MLLKKGKVNFTIRSVRETAKSAARELGYPDLKHVQLKVIETFVKGCDVFAVLTTGYGKRMSPDCIRQGIGNGRGVLSIVGVLMLLRSLECTSHRA